MSNKKLKSITALEKLISDSHAEIRKIQDRCPHSNAIRIHKSDTGNWCKQDDRYWTECNCPRCGKRWDDEQ